MKIVYTNTKGQCCVVHGAPKEMIEKTLGPLTDEQYKAHVWERSVPEDAINPVEVDESTIPNDREFRDAWTHDGKSFSHDLEKARAIQLSRIRIGRAEQLNSLDVSYQRADELNDLGSKKTIASQKQSLRDATNELKSMQLSSIEDVKNHWPSGVNRPEKTWVNPTDKQGV